MFRKREIEIFRMKKQEVVHVCGLKEFARKSDEER